MVFGMVAFIIQLAVLGGIVAAVVLVVNRRRSGASPSINADTPRDVFTYLLTTISLYVSAAGAMLIISGLADYWFPGLEYLGEPWTESARIGISMAIVAFPILLYLTKLSRTRLRSGETSPDSRLRQAFIYLSLFVASVVVLVDLMVVIYDLLSGDLTARFLMKAVGLLLLAGLVFRYYQLDLSIRPEGPMGGIPQVSAVAAPLAAEGSAAVPGEGSTASPAPPSSVPAEAGSAPPDPSRPTPDEAAEPPFEPSPKGPEGAA
jgi:hypothetical protein